MGDVLGHVGEALADVIHKGRAAGTGEELLFGQLLCFPPGHHVGAQRHFYHIEEAQGLQAGDHLLHRGMMKLAGDGGGYNGKDLVFLVVFRFLDQVNAVQNEGFVGNGAEGALIDTGAASDTLAVVDGGLFVFVHVDGAHFAGVFTGTGGFDDGAVGAGADAAAALDALFLIDDSPMVHNGDCSLGAGVHAPVGDAATAGFGDPNAGHRTFVTGDIDDLDHIVVFRIAAHGHAQAFFHDGPLLVDAAAHGGLRAGNQPGGAAQKPPGQIVFPGQSGHFLESLVFQLLYLCIKNHSICSFPVFFSGKISSIPL